MPLLHTTMTKRLVSLCALLVVCLLPSRADAHFWEWLDSLSGPRFHGYQIDYRVWCGYEPESRIPPAGGSGGATQTGPAQTSSAQQKASEEKERSLGFIVSLCKTRKPETRLARALALNVQWGQNANDDHYDQISLPDGSKTGVDNKMVGIGANYLASPWDWAAFGTGIGVTWFSSNRAEAFHKVYLQPYVIDVKPLVFWRKKGTATDVNAPAGNLKQILVFRYNTLIYPTGFEAGRFHDGNPRYPAELVHQVGFYFDLQPLVERFPQQKR